jgi:hypothetical protein
MDFSAIMKDPRRRNLAVLTLLAVLTVAWAAFALWQQSAQMAPKHHPHAFFPGLQARNVSRIHIASKSGTVDLALKPEKGWVLTSRNDFPASFETVRQTLIGMQTLQALEPKTDRPEWLHFLGLDAPPKGDGVLIALSDDKGHTLASLIAGKSEDIGDSSGGMGLFVRKPDSNQSWLAKSVFEAKSNPADWLEKKLFDLDRSRIRETDVTPFGSPAYVVSRAKPADSDFVLTVLPKGRELSYPGSPNGPGAALTGFTFDDIKPAKDVDFTNAWRVQSKTFDGLEVTAQIVKQGQDIWATISAEGEPGKPAAAKEARAIDAKTAGWAYKLPAYKGQQLMSPLESLLKPLNAPNQPAAAPTDDSDSDQSDQ